MKHLTLEELITIKSDIDNFYDLTLNHTIDDVLEYPPEVLKKYPFGKYLTESTKNALIIYKKLIQTIDDVRKSKAIYNAIVVVNEKRKVEQ